MASKSPLRLWVLVNLNGTVLVAHCTCMAGLAETFSHVGAILHWVEAAVRIRDDTPSTSKDNRWLMPTPMQSIPFLQLSEIDFTAPKCQKTMPAAKNVATPPTTSCNVSSPSETEKEYFFREIAKEKEKKPIILSVIEPYCNDGFIHSSDHLPYQLQGLFKPIFLESNLSELLTLAENYVHKEITPAMVDHLAQLTHEQSKSKNWFRYRAGRITASHFRRVIHTNPHQPSHSLLKSICYPEANKFTTKATLWGCEHEKNALQLYKTKMVTNHKGLNITRSGFYASLEHPFLGATPDGLVECACCGKGVVEVKCPLCAESCLGALADDNSGFCLEGNSIGMLQLKHSHMHYYQCQLQIYVTKRSFCDFVVWSNKELHIEHITLDKSLIDSSLPIAERFFMHCILPELYGKWYTRAGKPSGKDHSLPPPTEVDDGSWYYCKAGKGGDMVACDNESCTMTWFHLECVGMSVAPLTKSLWPTCRTNKSKNRKKR